MALVDVLSKLEHALGMLAASPTIPHRAETALLGSTTGISNVSSLVMSDRGGSPSNTAVRALRELPGIAPSVPPLSFMSFIPTGALTDLLSAGEPRTPTLIRRNDELGQQPGESREVGIDSRSNLGFAIDRDALGQPRRRGVVDGYESRGPTQITVNVQTIDSRSFLDHSEDIAHALRRSLLTDNPLGDVP
jgi:hypothetical protein